ncbi:hypothetical protein EDB95_4491 [Dinghuibacter silviterrae]|uniref:Uncharacterized protein n=1 Tax=Dinghuibacter silviterrae TaxID=1539049 RepID=A0A4R8DHQ7_9BACT|nr:hypothetical protein EDB95_4491 [Dinghuibacter silviterrae]
MHNPIPKPPYPLPIYIRILSPDFLRQPVSRLPNNFKVPNNRIDSLTILNEFLI